MKIKTLVALAALLLAGCHQDLERVKIVSVHEVDFSVPLAYRTAPFTVFEDVSTHERFTCLGDYRGKPGETITIVSTIICL